jgi:hypothetical protein
MQPQILPGIKAKQIPSKDVKLFLAPLIFETFHQYYVVHADNARCKIAATRILIEKSDEIVYHVLKFIHSEKATKFCEIFPSLLTTVHRVKALWRFRKILWSSQNI